MIALLALAASGCSRGLDRSRPPWHGRVVNAHEHIESLEEAPKLLAVMDRIGFAKTVLVGSSRFTITLDQRHGFEGIDANNEELMKIADAYPGRFEAWPTVDPRDPTKLEKFKGLVARGATGLKLYLGHGFVSELTGDWMFHLVALDDPGMLPLYAYCEREFIPVCYHVNPGPKTPGLAEEFVAVLDRFPDLKVNCPHFMLSSIRDSRLREFLDTYPNLVTDVSFGHDDYLKQGLRRISANRGKFRGLFTAYPNRFLYATDCVITSARRKTEDWIEIRFRAYLDMLTADSYTTPLLPGERLRGLALPDELAEAILFRNYESFVAGRPRGTRIEREIDWERAGLTPSERRPGERSAAPG